MRLSTLQQFILLECLDGARRHVARAVFMAFYRKKPSSPSGKDRSLDAAPSTSLRNSVRDFAEKRLETGGVRKRTQQDAVTKSLERLIDKGLLIGYGRRTPKKWFIDEVILTPKGRKETKKLLGKQQKLPFTLKKSK